MKLTTGRLKEIIKEEVTAALNEQPSRQDQLRNAIEIWMTSEGLEPKNPMALKVAVIPQLRLPPEERHPALQDISGQWGVSGPDFEAEVHKAVYKAMGKEEPERAAQPEEKESEAQRRRREASVDAIDRKMGGRYR